MALVVGSALSALVLLAAYLRGTLGGGSTLQQVVLILIFVLLLLSTVLPLRYVRVDYRL